MIRPYRSKLVFVLRLSDTTISALTLLLVLYIRGIATGDHYLFLMLLAIVYFSFFAIARFSFVDSIFGIYRSVRESTLSQMVWSVIMAWGFVVFTLFILVAGRSPIRRVFFVFPCKICPFGTGFFRIWRASVPLEQFWQCTHYYQCLRNTSYVWDLKFSQNIADKICHQIEKIQWKY